MPRRNPCLWRNVRKQSTLVPKSPAHDAPPIRDQSESSKSSQDQVFQQTARSMWSFPAFDTHTPESITTMVCRVRGIPLVSKPNASNASVLTRCQYWSVVAVGTSVGLYAGIQWVGTPEYCSITLGAATTIAASASSAF